MKEYLDPTNYFDYDHEKVAAYGEAHVEPEMTDREKAVALYYAVRDDFRYYPFYLDLQPSGMKASHILTKETGYCIEKSIVLGATCRYHGIPARLGFANVRNHIGTERLAAFLGSDLMVFHGYTDIYLDGKWVKATPAFNLELCEKLGVDPLEFDGTEDSIFQEYSKDGGQFMDYVHHYGTFGDMPFDLFLAELQKHYPPLFEVAETTDEGFVIGIPQ